MKKIFYVCLPFFVLATIISGLVYVAIQQTIRMSANDPQIQIAEDSAALLMNGVAPEAVTGSSVVDIDKSLAVFVSVFDEKGTLIKSSARLGSI